MYKPRIGWILLVLLLFCVQKSYSIEKQRTVLVTGGAGFIGSNFVKYMHKKHPKYKFIILDALTYSSKLDNLSKELLNSNRVKFVHGSICDKKLVDQCMSQSDFVVHFAAETDVTRSICSDEVFFETNVMGTRNLLHYLVKHKNIVKKFIHISSSEVYGTCERDVISENHPINPMSPYAASKAGADRAVFAYGCTFNVPVTILRCFNNYGPGQHIEKLVGKFIVQAINNQKITVHGNGEQMRDWLFVGDTARAIDAALHVKDFNIIKNQAINCGTGTAISVIEIAKKILHAFGLDESYISYEADRPGQVFKHLSSMEKAKSLLNWEPVVDFDTGLLLTISWYKEHPHFWKKELQDKQIYKKNDQLLIEKLNK